jgi:hypothetical protein
VREGSTNTVTTGELLSAMGIVPVADVVRKATQRPPSRSVPGHRPGTEPFRA